MDPLAIDMAEDPQPMTLQQRIAALNASHVGRVPSEVPLNLRPKPQIPLKRPIVIRQRSVNTPPERVTGTITATNGIANQPARDPQPPNIVPPPLPVRENPRTSLPSKAPPPLPRRQPSRPPPLPERKESSENSRRGSGESTHSDTTNTTYDEGTSLTKTRSKSSERIKAPAWGEEKLPPLPTRGASSAPRSYSTERPKYANRAPKSTETIIPAVTLSALNSKVERPDAPRLPTRRPSDGSLHERTFVTVSSNDIIANKAPPMPSIETINKFKQSAHSLGVAKPAVSKNSENLTNGLAHGISHAPPIPLSSRPDLASLQLTKPKSTTSAVSPDPSAFSNVCLVCRDFSAPDYHATRFPRTQVTSLQLLAQQLTAPFPSLTDKARTIFVWLHYNIRYDVESFFNDNVRGSTPQSTLQTGLAVCEGYAALFTNLATYAGLESIVIGGHGKGYGYQPLAPGSSLPPFASGHAWNAVKIDNGEWKLIDPCWGAGHVQGKGMPYVAKFNETMFNMSNEEFGIKHFPANKEHFFLSNGARMSWEEYIVINPANWPSQVEAPTVFTNAREDYGIGERTVMPRNRHLSVSSDGSVRFQFGLLCPHWSIEHHTKKGPPPVFILALNGMDGRSKDHVPLEYIPGTGSSGGDMWYVDVAARELGAAGQSVTLFAVTSFGNRQEARGLTVKEFREGKGKVGMAFQGVAAWDLVK